MLMRETKPQAIYRGELNGTLYVGVSILFVIALCGAYILGNLLPSWWPLLWGSGCVLAAAGLYSLAERRALIRCARAGVLGYVRTREEVRNKHPQQRSELEFTSYFPLPTSVKLNTGKLYRTKLAAVVLCWCFFSFGAMVWLIWPQVSIVLFLEAGLCFGINFAIQRAKFRVHAEGITLGLKQLRWEDVCRCEITRDYGTIFATEDRPLLAARFFALDGRKLLTLCLLPKFTVDMDDYLRLEAAIYVHLGGRDPLPSTQTATSHGA